MINLYTLKIFVSKQIFQLFNRLRLVLAGPNSSSMLLEIMPRGKHWQASAEKNRIDSI